MKSDSLSAGVAPVSRDDGNGTTDAVERRKSISDRLEYLSTVEDGWFEGRGVALDKAGLRWLDNQVADHFVSTDLPLPFIFPTVPGGVMVEWSTERFEGAIEIDLEARTGLWVDVDLETGESIDDQILDLDSADGWQWLIDRLAKLIAKSQPCLG